MAIDTDVSTGIRAALAVRLKREVSAIQIKDDLRNDLGLDSLDMIELLFKIEEVFDLEIPNEDLVQIATVGDVIAYVERRLVAKAAAPQKPPAQAPKPVKAPKAARVSVRSPAKAPKPAPARKAARASAAPARKPSGRRPAARSKPAPKRAAAKKKKKR